MHGRLRLTALLLAAFSLGCVATRHPVPLEEPRNDGQARSEFARWVVGVREPMIRYSEPDDEAPDVLDEVEQAAYLIHALRETRLFAAVDFTNQFTCAPDIELVVVPRKGDRLEPAHVWLWLFMLTLVLEEEQGVAFAPADDPAVVFEFPYRTTLAIGVVPLLASPVTLTGLHPNWSLGADPYRELRAFILSNATRLTPLVVEPRREPCESTVP